MSATASLELLKAHAVISRSWLLNKLKVANGKLKVIMHPDNTANFELSTLPSQLIKWYDHEAHKNFDVCADDHCQRYQGITRTSTPQAIEAVLLHGVKYLCMKERFVTLVSLNVAAALSKNSRTAGRM